MAMITVCVELDEETYRALQGSRTNNREGHPEAAADALKRLAQLAADGLIKARSWERTWISTAGVYRSLRAWVADPEAPWRALPPKEKP